MSSSIRFQQSEASYLLESPLKKWRESLNQKYGNAGNQRCNYEYEEWHDGMKDKLSFFYEEVEEQIRKNRENYELDCQRMSQIQNDEQKFLYENNEKCTEHYGNLESSKKRKFEN
jgi:hypothetical protein